MYQDRTGRRSYRGLARRTLCQQKRECLAARVYVFLTVSQIILELTGAAKRTAKTSRERNLTQIGTCEEGSTNAWQGNKLAGAVEQHGNQFLRACGWLRSQKMVLIMRCERTTYDLAQRPDHRDLTRLWHCYLTQKFLCLHQQTRPRRERTLLYLPYPLSVLLREEVIRVPIDEIAPSKNVFTRDCNGSPSGWYRWR